VAELTVTATAYALQDAADAAHRRDRRKWDDRKGPDYYEMAAALMDLGFIVVKKEQDG
jgi:hypothetical protein